MSRTQQEPDDEQIRLIQAIEDKLKMQAKILENLHVILNNQPVTVTELIEYCREKFNLGEEEDKVSFYLGDNSTTQLAVWERRSERHRIIHIFNSLQHMQDEVSQWRNQKLNL